MYKGIKPTHLWHLTSKKYIERCIKDRELAAPPHNQRDIKDQLQLVGVVLASLLGFMCSYGVMCGAKKAPAQVICDDSKCKSKSKDIKGPTDPCPPKPSKAMKPCRGEE